MNRAPHTWRQRLLAIVALLAQLAGTIGLPMPVRQVSEEIVEEKETPPRVHRCGCPIDEKGQGCCCCTKGGCCSGAETETPADEVGVQWSGGVWTSRCHGDPPGWLLSVIAVPLPPADETFRPLVVSWLTTVDEHAEPLTLPLPEPPPRFLA